MATVHITDQNIWPIAHINSIYMMQKEIIIDILPWSSVQATPSERLINFPGIVVYSVGLQPTT